jgi:phosphatidylserine/phosphatidylglycerophosphate/cardiolipin synthase-like enzyme
MNEILRRALFRARLGEEDIAASLAVDPKTVRRWIEGRIPYPRHRRALAKVLRASERDLWPDLPPEPDATSQTAEVVAVYPHRSAVPREVWRQLFDGARREICILDYSSLFLAEDSELLDTLVAKANAGVAIRIALGDPNCPRVTERGTLGGNDEATAAEIRNALALYRPLQDASQADIRLHRTVLYSSTYRADEHMLVNQHAYAIPAAHGPAFHVHGGAYDGIFDSYCASFERIWLVTVSL